MSFCILYNVVSKPYSELNSLWGMGSISSSWSKYNNIVIDINVLHNVNILLPTKISENILVLKYYLCTVFLLIKESKTHYFLSVSFH